MQEMKGFYRQKGTGAKNYNRGKALGVKVTFL